MVVWKKCCYNPPIWCNSDCVAYVYYDGAAHCLRLDRQIEPRQEEKPKPFAS